MKSPFSDPEYSQRRLEDASTHPKNLLAILHMALNLEEGKTFSRGQAAKFLGVVPTSITRPMKRILSEPPLYSEAPALLEEVSPGKIGRTPDSEPHLTACLESYNSLLALGISDELNAPENEVRERATGSFACAKGEFGILELDQVAERTDTHQLTCVYMGLVSVARINSIADYTLRLNSPATKYGWFHQFYR